MTKREPPGGRLSVDDWIEAGYAILADDGLPAVKIDRLCARLGVTKGSFYWHFSDIAGYRAALIDAWAEQRGDELAVFVYADSEQRLIATTRMPRLVLGEVTFLEVTAVTAIGAFVDWGLGKELLVPFAEQTKAPAPSLAPACPVPAAAAPPHAGASARRPRPAA